ncbi:serine/threonine-protein kinase [Streptomyces sp. NPDC005017]|uniref:serine/threonine-protein kinase n=1 Tax=Streptomyces sp. NPDC005017 TaxID=3364706 RepID=UPI00368382A7
MAPQGNTGIEAEAELPEYAGHYLLESCLGSGGMGVVHQARSTSGMTLAVKVVHAEFARDPEFRGRFRQEVAAARRVSGAFTASVVDADPDAERPWMATLFIPGPTLSDHVKRNGPMNTEQLRRLMAGLAEALRDIHRVGVVHRDLKPSNVLLAEDGPKVIDFGISRPKDSELRTETGKLIGTPPFMAPEQFRRPREVGPAADIFALGSVMVHAATGRGPFDSDSPYVVAYQVVHDEPDLAGVPDGLAPLVSRCLAKEPAERPTPDELMRELRSVAASYDTQAFIPTQRTGGVERPEPRTGEPSRTAPPTAPRRSRRRVAVVAAGAALVLAVTGTVLALVGGGGEPRRPAGDRHPATAAVRAWETRPVRGEEGAAQCSYGSSAVLCARPGTVFALSPSDGSVLWRTATAGSRVSSPPVLSGGLVQPMAEESSRMAGLDPASGEPLWEREMPAHVALRPAGDMLLLTGADGGITGVDSATGKPVWSHRVEGLSTPYFMSFAGDPLAYAVDALGDGSSEVVALDPTTGEVRWKAELRGELKPVGSHEGSLFLVAADQLHEDVSAVVRYDPASGASRRVRLPVSRDDPRVGVHGNTVYLLTAGGSLEAVDMDAGKRIWVLETAVSRGSDPVADSGQVYVSTPDGRLLAVDAGNGRLLGQTPPRPADASDVVPAYLPAPVVSGTRVYASAPDGTVFSVPARNPAAW